MLLKTFSRSLLAMAITTAIAAEPIIIDSAAGSGAVSVISSDQVTVVSGGAIITPFDGIEIDGSNLNIPFINVDLGGSITAELDGIFVTGTNNTVGSITINGNITSGGGGFTDIAGVNINTGNTVNGGITFSASSVFSNTSGCVLDLGFCDGGAVISTQGTHTGDLLLQGFAAGPVGIQLLEGATTGNLINSGTLTVFTGGFQVLSGSTVNGDVHNDVTGMLVSSVGIVISSEKFVFNDLGATGNVSEVVAGDQVTINGSVINAGSIGGGMVQGVTITSFDGITLSDDVIVTGNILNSGTIDTVFGITLGRFGFGDFLTEVVSTGPSALVQGDIINTGVINTDSEGIFLYDEATVEGSILNSGTINSGDTGISVAGSSTVMGSITNSGTISSQFNHAISVFESTVGSILNDTTGTLNAGDDIILVEDSTVLGAIVNNGSIGLDTFSGEGIDIESSTIAGGITNSGSIIGDFAIETELSDISGGITNTTTGTITGRGNVIAIEGGNVSGGINNDGLLVINSVGDGATIEIGPGLGEDEITERYNGTVFDSSFSDGINNTSNGTILNTATLTPGLATIDNVSAVWIVAATVDGGINNAGDIGSDTDDAILLTTVSSLDEFAVPGTVLNDGLTNTGEIFSGGGAGIYSSGAQINGGIANSGDIEGKQGIVIDGLELALVEVEDPQDTSDTIDQVSAISINANAGVVGDINNSGLIRSTINASEIAADPLQAGNGNFGALTVLYGASVNGDIINSASGRIEATGAGIGIVVGSGGNDLSGLNSLISGGIAGLPLATPPVSSVTGEINNSGIISSVNSAAIYVDLGSLGGIVNNADGTITGGNGLAIKAELTSVVDVAGAAASSIGFVTNAGTINGSIDFGNGGGTFNGLGGNSGSVIGASALTIQLADGATSDTETRINGDFSFSGPITLDVKGVSVSGVNDPIYGVLSIIGAADLTGSTLDIDVTADNFINNGTELVFLDATSLTSDLTSATDNSAVVDFTVAQQGNTLVATAIRSAFEDVIQQDATGAQGNTQAVASGLTAAAGQISAGAVDADSSLGLVVSGISALGTTAEVVAAVQSLEPEAVSSSSVGAISADGASAGTVNARMASLRGTGFSGAVAGDDVSLSGFWMQLYDSNTDQDTIDEVDGFDADTYGIALGLDASLKGGYNVGVAFSFADTDMDSDGVENNSLEIQSYRLTAYGSYNAPEYFVDAQIAYAMNQYEGTRNLFGGLQARNDHDGDQYSLRMRVGKPIALENGLFITLKASAEYTYLDEESYSEKGADNAGLTVDTDTVDAFVIGAGIDFAYPITTANEITWIPELSLEVQRDLIGQEIEVDSNFVGVAAAAFTTEGANVEQTGINLGVGLRAFGEGDISVSLRADYLYKKDYKNLSGSVTVRYGF